MPVLTPHQRKLLDDACVLGRRMSEQAVRAALSSLAVTAERPPTHLGEEARDLRRGLRAKSRQLGDQGDNLDLLVAECAYEQWHRLLFARFLAESDLLIHPEYRAPVTLYDCEELAESLGEPDGWAVAARFAAEILPGIFRRDDPCVQLRLTPEGRLALENIVAELPSAVFVTDDALGWAYQLWQREQKDEVNRAERKIAGADLGPVTQLFTERYMVQFLLQNSLGAWWASRRPKSPLIASWEYLRFDGERDDSTAAGAFQSWPNVVADVSVLDPCCGSGHFLVEAFDMLWRMRMEDEGSTVVTAQDAVLETNLFGLELDPRCVQIAMFALALRAWKEGGGWRELPIPHVACSGIPAKADVVEWKALAAGEELLESALSRLHIMFREADTLGSLIDPQRTVGASSQVGAQGSFGDVEWEQVAPLLERLLSRERRDPAASVLGVDAAGLARAAAYLSRRYTLVATNVPYLARSKQGEVLRDFSDRYHETARNDLATVFLGQCERLSAEGGTTATVSPQNWLHLQAYTRFRRRLFEETTWNFVARIGSGATATKSWDTLRVLLISTSCRPEEQAMGAAVDALSPSDEARAWELRTSPLAHFGQAEQLSNPDARFAAGQEYSVGLLSERATAYQGVATGDYSRFGRFFWEVPLDNVEWVRQQSTVVESAAYSGREHVVFWQNGSGDLARSPQARIQGQPAWGKQGVAITQTRVLPVTLYTGEMFDNNTSALVPSDPADLPALWAFCSSAEYVTAVRAIDSKLGVTNATLAKVPFDVQRWSTAAEALGPLPDPHSDDPTQWLFGGQPDGAAEPLLVAVARLLGFRWPNQTLPDDLDSLADEDGIVCLPSVRGERPAAERIQELVARSGGVTWSPSRTLELLREAGSNKSDLDTWLRDEFFKAHCQVFGSRPFIWHVWDGRKDGFSALLNYHRLGRGTVEKLTYSYLGDWIERQLAGVRDDVPGAEDRVAAARSLQKGLTSSSKVSRRMTFSSGGRRWPSSRSAGSRM
jgi:hypothetical protein